MTNQILIIIFLIITKCVEKKIRKSNQLIQGPIFIYHKQVTVKPFKELVNNTYLIIYINNKSAIILILFLIIQKSVDKNLTKPNLKF